MKKELMKYVGNISQVAYARNIEYKDGRANGLSAILVNNGKLSFTVTKDNCLDIVELSYKGSNIHYLSKPGIGVYNKFSDPARAMMGGLFFTCGLQNVGPAEENKAMHGHIRNIPAENVSVQSFFREDDYVIQIKGEMRETQIFGENLVLYRTIETTYNSETITIHDEIVNEAYRDEPCMVLYHFNMGYPLLKEGSTLSITSKKAIARDSTAEKGLTSWNEIIAPVDNKTEEVFYHELEEGINHASLSNGKMKFCLEFNKKELPFFTQWKSMASGDYALGLEPGNCHVEGQLKEKERGTLEYIKPFQKKEVHLSITMSEIEP